MAVTDNSNVSAIRCVTVDDYQHPYAIYNLAGQKVANDFKGLVIKNGRTFIQ